MNLTATHALSHEAGPPIHYDGHLKCEKCGLEKRIELDMVKDEQLEKGMVDGLYKVLCPLRSRSVVPLTWLVDPSLSHTANHNITAPASKTETSYFLTSAWPSSTVKSRRNSPLGGFLSCSAWCLLGPSSSANVMDTPLARGLLFACTSRIHQNIVLVACHRSSTCSTMCPLSQICIGGLCSVEVLVRRLPHQECRTPS
ncbi:hypothetical protein PISMIDRAFT_625282 [Pisolithus microcarpus 441]|uniref:Uncharacterized protein n=1 Tax=Pisolithus microcarpus 441 TaxID=765257 RepID=A0A0C9YS51_9AGAM|nr:hypothetical protein PISMIDRAFT_625282 [Pisolithus microcarpus 441]